MIRKYWKLVVCKLINQIPSFFLNASCGGLHFHVLFQIAGGFASLRPPAAAAGFGCRPAQPPKAASWKRRSSTSRWPSGVSNRPHRQWDTALSWTVVKVGWPMRSRGAPTCGSSVSSRILRRSHDHANHSQQRGCTAASRSTSEILRVRCPTPTTCSI